jgi:tRNA A37 threonylcarbamoyladenosine dehydratase
VLVSGSGGVGSAIAASLAAAGVAEMMLFDGSPRRPTRSRAGCASTTRSST